MKNLYTSRRLTAEYIDSLNIRDGERIPRPRASRWERAKALLFAAALLGLVATAATKGYLAFSNL